MSYVCRAPRKHSNRSNPTRTQLRFSYKSRVRMGVRWFEGDKTFHRSYYYSVRAPNALGG